MIHYLRSKRVTIGRRSFTLIELLVSIGIVAVLSTVAIVTLNPAELFKQARDSNRIASLDALRKAITLYGADKGFSSIGTPYQLYISLPDDNSPTCDTLKNAGSLPALPGPPQQPQQWEYRCATSQNLRKTDGTGWIPIDFGAIGAISVLPIDPINKVDVSDPIQNYFMSYATDGSGRFEVNIKMESVKYGFGGQ